jgi:hypothetical protein
MTRITILTVEIYLAITITIIVVSNLETIIKEDKEVLVRIPLMLVIFLATRITTIAVEICLEILITEIIIVVSNLETIIFPLVIKRITIADLYLEITTLTKLDYL